MTAQIKTWASGAIKGSPVEIDSETLVVWREIQEKERRMLKSISLRRREK
jgi:hypothetical protein